ncbi:MAG: FAD:protein FMN transferase [Halothiobacillaceae bacterium]|nr:FAD:protein FMN transferase [Halothiobacillaceae bacterium]
MIDSRRRALMAALAGIPLGPLLGGCAAESPLNEGGFSVFGQVWTLTFFDTPPGRINDALARAEKLVEPLYRRLHPWKDSELTRLNRQLAMQGEARVSDDIRALIEAARPLFEASGGRFDPTIGGLIEQWGFHRDGGRDQPFEPPPDAALDDWLADAPSLDDVHLEGNRVRVDNRRVQFDFNSLAEGFAAQRVLASLDTLGVTDCLLDTGGDLYTRGRPGDRDWQLGIRDPRGEGSLGGVALAGHRALCSSGNYERHIRYRGEDFGHILDPLTARPVHGNAGTTVLARDPVTADGAATALMLITPQEASTFARRLGLDGILLVTENGEPWRDAKMRQAMQSFPANGPANWRTL